MNKDRKKNDARPKTSQDKASAQVNEDLVALYESAELDMEDDTFTPAKPTSSLDVSGANRDNDISTYESVGETGATSGAQFSESELPLYSKVSTGFEKGPDDATRVPDAQIVRQNAEASLFYASAECKNQNAGSSPFYASTDVADPDECRKPPVTTKPPVYGKVNKKSKKTNNKDTANLPSGNHEVCPVYEDADGIDQTGVGVSSAPVYDQVEINGHKKIQANDDSECGDDYLDKNGDEGFVDNIIYISSGQTPESQA